MEEIEEHDWGVTPSMSNSERKERSISAYYLPEWYEYVKDFTFPTSIHKILPETFPKSMVRWEHKSPKDSEYWGPVTTREEAERLFETSLRCQTNKGKIYCLRDWIPLGDEYRCFWNGKLTAVSAESDIPPSLIDYLVEIAPRIPYYRCVIDIAQKLEGGYWLIEFNSWETNSGAQRFEWNEPVLYDSDNGKVEARSPNQTVYFEWPLPSTLPKLVGKSIPLSEITIDSPNCPSNWIVHDDNLYCSDDVWLVKISKDFEIKRWRRGPFRFTTLQATDNGIIADTQGYWYDLTPAPLSKLGNPETVPKSGNYPYKYGFAGKYRGEEVFVRFYQYAFYVY